MAQADSLTAPNAQQIQVVKSMAGLYANAAEQLVGQVFGNITYKQNGRGSTPIPTGFLLSGCTAHVHYDVTFAGLAAGVAPPLSFLGQLSGIEEIVLKYNGMQSEVFQADALFAAQRFAMEYPYSNLGATWNAPVINGNGTYGYDWYLDVPALYSDATMMGLLNVNSNDVHPSIETKWGSPDQNMFTLPAGGTATVAGYIEFIAKRVTPPQSAADGAPDLSKNYTVSYQDFTLAASKNNRLELSASDTITRLTLNFMEGGTGNGSDVASYDASNALQVQNVKLGYASLVGRFDRPYWDWQLEAAKNYGNTFKNWINRGTVVIDLDKTGGRDWIDASKVTSLALTVDLGAAPPQGSKVRVYTEQLVNTSDIPLR